MRKNWWRGRKDRKKTWLLRGDKEKEGGPGGASSSSHWKSRQTLFVPNNLTELSQQSLFSPLILPPSNIRVSRRLQPKRGKNNQISINKQTYCSVFKVHGFRQEVYSYCGLEMGNKWLYTWDCLQFIALWFQHNLNKINGNKISWCSSHLVSVVEAVIHEPGDQRGLSHWEQEKKILLVYWSHIYWNIVYQSIPVQDKHEMVTNDEMIDQ